MMFEYQNLSRKCLLTVNVAQRDHLLEIMMEMRYRYVVLTEEPEFTIETKRLYVTNLNVLKKRLRPTPVKKPLKQRKTTKDLDVITSFFRISGSSSILV